MTKEYLEVSCRRDKNDWFKDIRCSEMRDVVGGKCKQLQNERGESGQLC